jgi:hypothetical protein
VPIASPQQLKEVIQWHIQSLVRSRLWARGLVTGFHSRDPVLATRPEGVRAGSCHARDRVQRTDAPMQLQCVGQEWRRPQGFRHFLPCLPQHRGPVTRTNRAGYDILLRNTPNAVTLSSAAVIPRKRTVPARRSTKPAPISTMSTAYNNSTSPSASRYLTKL